MNRQPHLMGFVGLSSRPFDRIRGPDIISEAAVVIAALTVVRRSMGGRSAVRWVG